jgi:hypothetical protein
MAWSFRDRLDARMRDWGKAHLSPSPFDGSAAWRGRAGISENIPGCLLNSLFHRQFLSYIIAGDIEACRAKS